MSFYFKLCLLLPEIFISFWLTFLLLAYTIISKRKNPLVFRKKIYFPKLSCSVWLFLLLLSLLYFLLIFTSIPHFYTSFGLYSNNLIYLIRLILSFLFILYLLYLRIEIQSAPFHSFEFLIILFFSFMSLNLILVSCNLINLFIFIELFSLTLYFLLITNKKSAKSIEAALKYFIFGSVSSSFLLFGFYLLYFSTGTQDLFDLSLITFNNELYSSNACFIFASLIVSLSLLLKIGGSFFFFWVADVYDGANFPLLLYLNTFLKIVYVFKLFHFLHSFNLISLTIFIKSLIISTFLFGLLGALYQTKTKKFLIFTSLYNISFFAIMFWNLSNQFVTILILYTFVYLVTSMSYIMLFSLIKDWDTNLTIKSLLSLTNLKIQNPTITFFFLAFSFLSAGLPPSFFFLLKFSIFFQTALQLNFILLFCFLFVSTLSFFLYIRLVRLVLRNDKPLILLKPIPKLGSFILSFVLVLNVVLFLFFDKLLLYSSFLAYAP